MKRALKFRSGALLIAVAFFALLFPPSHAQVIPPRQFGTSSGLSVARPGTWEATQRGVEVRTATLQRSEPAQTIDLKLVRLDQRWWSPRVLYGDELGLKAADVKTFATLSGAVVAVNASYFDEHGRPLGFLKTTRSRPHTNISKSSLFTGVFGVRNSVAFIAHRDELELDDGLEAVQAGPLLLRNGAPLTVTRGAGRQSRRSVVGLDKDRKIIVGVTDNFVGGLTWTELQQLFDPRAGVIPAIELLNLDGGGSSQLYIKGAPSEYHVPGATPVPVALGFFAKGN
ncbi:MAG TPA: phosphodiester glycosidase family protein [Candidatus Acidoferrales bacterium]|nr:phosphodiester glycosidase family protein [Candidatus Acidoferrales bacterium]